MIVKKENIKSILLTMVACIVSVALYASTNNIAPMATITASTELNAQYKAANIADGIIGVDGKGEWACEGVSTDWGYIRFPWIQLQWEQPQTINRIVLYDRPSEAENIAGGRLIFSDGSEIYVNQLPKNGLGKAITFEAKTVSWVKFEVTDGTGKDLGFSEIEVFPAPWQNENNYVSWVDPYIETNRGRYFFFVTGSRPFGMVSAAPHTRNKNQNGGGYNYNETEILGFGQIHCWMLSGIEIMPATANTSLVNGEAGWKSTFSHDDEIVQPGYQRVFLQNHNAWAEMTATERVSFYKFRYTKDEKAQIIVNLGGYLSNSTMANADAKVVNGTALEGSFSSVKRYWGGPKDVKIFFVARFDKPFKSVTGWQDGKTTANVSGIKGDNAGLAPQYDVKAGEELQMKIAISYTSIENARNNLEKECTTWDFNAVRKETQDVWNEMLGRIEVQGKSHNDKIKFYTDLWHVLLGRHKLNDISGDYPDRTTGKRDGSFTDAIFKVKTLPKDAQGNVKYNMYNSDAFWLTQWNLNILWGLAWPEVQDDMSASMLQYADNGYLLPRGPSGGGYSYIMTGSPTTNLIVSTYMKGILTKVDANHAYDIVKRNMLPGGMLGSKEDIEFYTKNGWWRGNAGITIEAAFQDWGVAQMAKKLNKTKDYNFFYKRSESWKNCFDPQQKLLFPKNEKGQFTHSDALSGDGWVEANAWQGTWGVSQDIRALAKMMGGNDTLCEKLNFAFEQAQHSDFVFDYSGGYISYANQPGCSNAHVFNYAGKPWLTQYWVRKVKEQAYSGITPDLGYGGHDEDQGQMGGVSALMSLGLFSLQGTESQTPVYDITSPVFDNITIHLNPQYYKGKTFTIKANNNSKENCYIQKATLNGKPLNTFWFTHADYIKGGQLELWMDKAPNKSWGVEKLPE